MERKLFYKNVIISYSVKGRGEKVLLAFHGFGQEKNAYGPIANACENEYTTYSFDLFFHGASRWDGDLCLLTRDFWREVVQFFIQTEKISRFSLAGYSMGGKFVLATLVAFPDKVEKIILIAPDGIKKNLWYHLATGYGITRTLFKHTINNPKVFLRIAKVAESMSLVNKRVLKFVRTQMNTREQRERAYNSWVVFRSLKSDMQEVSSIINERKISLEIFLGRHDRMFTLKDLGPFLKKIKHYKLEILESGHNELLRKVGEYYKSHRK